MTAGLTTHLMTAGLSSDDYRFLGRAPRESFWRKYAEYTSFERPTAILLCREGVFKAYLSGIASARRDRTRTPLRYTLVLEGACRSPGADTLLGALNAFVEDLSSIAPGPLTVGALGRALDDALPEDFIEKALQSLRNEPPAPESFETGPLAEIGARLLGALEALPRPGDFPRSDQRFFSGGRASAASRAQFLGTIERLLIDGEPGAALVLNLASRDHLDNLAGSEASCAVLFAGEMGRDAFSEPLEMPPKKGRPGSPNGVPRAIVLREAHAEPGSLIPRLGRILMGALRTVRDFLLGRPRASS